MATKKDRDETKSGTQTSSAPKSRKPRAQKPKLDVTPTDVLNADSADSTVDNIVQFPADAVVDTVKGSQKSVDLKEESKPVNVAEAIDKLRLSADIWISGKTVAMTFEGGLVVKINTRPTIEEKIAFVKKVVDDSFLDNMDFYLSRSNSIFDVLFMLMFTNYSFPEQVKDESGYIDTQAAYNHIKQYDFIEKLHGGSETKNLIDELRADVAQRVESEKAKMTALLSRNDVLEDALNNINSLASSGIEFFAGATRKLDDLNISSDTLGNVIEMFKGGDLING